MNTQATDYQENIIYYSWRCLTQGFRLSPLLFSHSMHYILNKANRFKKDNSWVFFQDDIIVGGETKQSVEEVLNNLINFLTSFGFIINRDKISPPSETCTFCGYCISHSSVVPVPKRKIDEQSFDALWNEFKSYRDGGDRDSMLQWLRTQLGRLQFCARWFKPDAQIVLSKQYKYIKILQEDKFLMSICP
jgi:hypothetical protein